MAGNRTSLRYKDPDKITSSTDRVIRENLGKIQWVKLHEVFTPWTPELIKKMREHCKKHTAVNEYEAMVKKIREPLEKRKAEQKKKRIIEW